MVRKCAPILGLMGSVVTLTYIHMPHCVKPVFPFGTVLEPGVVFLKIAKAINACMPKLQEVPIKILFKAKRALNVPWNAKGGFS